MVQLAVTGNMGCGKTTICEMLISQGIPVYFSDNRAKELMNQDQSLIQHIQTTFWKGILPQWFTKSKMDSRNSF